MAGSDMAMNGCVHRIRSRVLELIEIGIEVMTDGFNRDVDELAMYWDLIQRELALKSTYLYIDFSKMISLVNIIEEKSRITLLANRLFASIDEVGNAMKERSIEMTLDRYEDTLEVLMEVIELVPRRKEETRQWLNLASSY